MSFEKEFEIAKIMLLFDKTIEKIKQMKSDLGVVDIPEFCKLPEDKDSAKADRFITQLRCEGRLDDSLLGLL